MKHGRREEKGSGRTEEGRKENKLRKHGAGKRVNQKGKERIDKNEVQ